jgi:hypothetical protein
VDFVTLQWLVNPPRARNWIIPHCSVTPMGFLAQHPPNQNEMNNLVHPQILQSIEGSSLGVGAIDYLATASSADLPGQTVELRPWYSV